MIHYLWNVQRVNEGAVGHITGQHSPFNHSPSVRLICNHVSSYIINYWSRSVTLAFQPGPNLIHVLPKKTEGCLVSGRREEREKGRARGRDRHAVSCRSYKKGCCGFLLNQPGNWTAIFSSLLYVGPGGHNVNTSWGSERRGEVRRVKESMEKERRR